jgi:preprotein translocase SecF subunit
MFNIIENRRWYFIASGILAVLSIAALVVSAIVSGLPLAVDVNAADPQTIQAAGLTVLVTAVVVMAFVWWSFRDTPNAFRCSASAIVVMAYNLIVPFGFYALMGLLADWQADALFFVAILAILGLSIQDVVAILDRIRENASARKQEPYGAAINRSILESLNPTLATRLCAVLILVALLFVGGPVILPLAATLLVGVVCETYSAMFIAALLLTL